MALISVLTISLGAYFTLTASHPSIHRRALLLNVGLRTVAAAIFWPKQRNTAINELVFAAVNFGAAQFAV